MRLILLGNWTPTFGPPPSQSSVLDWEWYADDLLLGWRTPNGGRSAEQMGHERRHGSGYPSDAEGDGPGSPEAEDEGESEVSILAVNPVTGLVEQYTREATAEEMAGGADPFLEQNREAQAEYVARLQADRARRSGARVARAAAECARLTGEVETVRSRREAEQVARAEARSESWATEVAEAEAERVRAEEGGGAATQVDTGIGGGRRTRRRLEQEPAEGASQARRHRMSPGPSAEEYEREYQYRAGGAREFEAPEDFVRDARRTRCSFGRRGGGQDSPGDGWTSGAGSEEEDDEGKPPIIVFCTTGAGVRRYYTNIDRAGPGEVRWGEGTLGVHAEFISLRAARDALGELYLTSRGDIRGHYRLMSVQKANAMVRAANYRMEGVESTHRHLVQFFLRLEEVEPTRWETLRGARQAAETAVAALERDDERTISAATSDPATLGAEAERLGAEERAEIDAMREGTARAQAEGLGSGGRGSAESAASSRRR
jgi:hypothetical protein